MINSSASGFHTAPWTEAVADLTRRGQAFVLATLLGSAGSTPRGAGTKMVISATDIYATVGGGHLELQIIEAARAALLGGQSEQSMVHFPLGASLGQCCGGSVSVLLETLVPEGLKVDLYGAGHVAHALVPLLAQLPVRVRWIDSRAALFPDSVPANVLALVDEDPVEQVRHAAPDTVSVVMTHDHGLDFRLCSAILKQGTGLMLGLIGSTGKAERFRLRLAHQGFSPEQIAQLQCPIGLAQVSGKLPMEVAVSIAGQLIALYQSRQLPAPVRQGLQWRQLKNTLIQSPAPVAADPEEINPR
jgi:xanthine dehydrogenase accessory factor